jgi:hypothetical protein
MIAILHSGVWSEDGFLYKLGVVDAAGCSGKNNSVFFLHIDLELTCEIIPRG